MRIEPVIPKSLIQENLDVFLTIYLKGFMSGSKKIKEGDIKCDRDDYKGYTECYVVISARPEDNLHQGFVYDETNKTYRSLDYLDTENEFPIEVEIKYYTIENKPYAMITARAR